MAADVVYCQVNNGFAQVTVTNDAGLLEVRAAAKSAFASLGVVMDPLANSYRSACLGEHFVYSQKVSA